MAGEKFIALEETSQEIKTAVEGISNSLNENLEQNLGLINSTIGTNNPVSLDTIILQAVYGNVFEYTNPGTYTLLIPANVNKIKVTACGGGGGGSGFQRYSYAGAGGGGAAAVINQEYSVTPQTTLSIQVGSGGNGGIVDNKASNVTDGANGQATVIQGVVTLAGGFGGKRGDSSSPGGYPGEAGGNGGGAGGKGLFVNTKPSEKSKDGEAGIVGAGGKGIMPGWKAGSTTQSSAGGGGGGSLGNGGNGSDGKTTNTGTKGSGGGGAGWYYTGSHYTKNGGKGGNGYVKIELIINA